MSDDQLEVSWYPNHNRLLNMLEVYSDIMKTSEVDVDDFYSHLTVGRIDQIIDTLIDVRNEVINILTNSGDDVAN